MRNNWRKIISRDLPVFVSFVLVATVLWWVRAINTSRDAVIYISVRYAGVGDDVSFVTVLPDHLMVEVHDSGQRIRQVNHEKPELVINLASHLSKDAGFFTIPSETIHERVCDLLPGTMSVMRIHPNHLDIEYYHQHKKVVPVQWVGTITPADQYQLRGDIQILPESITVYGKKEDVQAIAYVQTQALNWEQVQDSVCQCVELQPMDGIRFSESQVQVRCYSEQYTEKRFTLPIEVLGVPNGGRIRLFPSKAEIIVRVGIDYFPHLDQHDLHIYCKYPTQLNDKLPLIPMTKNEHVQQMRVVPGAVEYLIEK